MDSLQLEFHHESGILVGKLSGRLDGNSAPEFGRRVAEELAAGPIPVVLDVTDLAFISSAGLREFVGLAKRLSPAKLKASLVGVSPTVSEVLDISGLTALFLRLDSVESAKQQIAGSGTGSGNGLLGRLFSGLSKS